MNSQLFATATLASSRVNLGSLAIATKFSSVTAAPAVAAQAQVTGLASSELHSATVVSARTVNIPAEVFGTAKIRVDAVRVLDPALSKAISSIPLAVVGVPRDQIKVPISNSAEPSDQNLYEEVADSSKKLFLPHYGLATQIVSGQEQYWASLAASGNRWAFTLRLKKFPDARLGESARDAHELDHELNLLLRYMVPRSGGMQKELLFEEKVNEQGLVHATLFVNSIAERDELFFVLTDRNTPASLLARRTARIAIPVSGPAAAGPSPSSGTSTLRGTWFFDFANGAEGTAGDIWWEQMTNTVRRLVPQGQAGLARLGQIDFDALSLESLKQQQYSSQPIDGSVSPPTAAPSALTPIKFGGGFSNPLPVRRTAVLRLPMASIQAARQNQLTPGTVFAVKTNSGSYAKVKVLEYGYNLKLQWQTYPAAAAQVPLYRETTRTLDDVVPLTFDKDLHRYIFADLPGVGGNGSQPGFKRWTVRWNDRDHSYYQEVTRPSVFYYLPDAFKLARRPQSPHVPLLAFQLETDADSESPTVRLDYSAFKDEDEDRLANAATELKSKVPGNPTPVLMPINVDKPTFELALPRGGTSGPFQPRSGAAVSSSLGLADSLTGMPLQEFQAIWDAMADATGKAVLFQGRVRFNLPGEPGEDIPFVARLGDMAGDLLDATYKVIAEASNPDTIKSITATIRNSIESPVTVKTVKVQLGRGEVTVAGKIDALRRGDGSTSATLPVTLAPGESIEIDVSPASALPATGQVSASFDFDEVGVQPDLPEVLKVIALNQKPESSRKVEIATFAEVFKPPLTQFRVEFERGKPVTLSTTALETSTKVRFSVLDSVGRKPEAAQYRYRIVTAAGTRDWRTDTSDSITITSDLLP